VADTCACLARRGALFAGVNSAKGSKPSVGKTNVHGLSGARRSALNEKVAVPRVRRRCRAITIQVITTFLKRKP